MLNLQYSALKETKNYHDTSVVVSDGSLSERQILVAPCSGNKVDILTTRSFQY